MLELRDNLRETIGSALAQLPKQFDGEKLRYVVNYSYDQDAWSVQVFNIDDRILFRRERTYLNDVVRAVKTELARWEKLSDEELSSLWQRMIVRNNQWD